MFVFNHIHIFWTGKGAGDVAGTAYGNYILITFGSLCFIRMIYGIFAKHHSLALALLTPIIPILLVMFAGWAFIPAFIAALLWGLFSTWDKNSLRIFSKTMIEGAESVIPAVLLMIGIGMLLKSVTHPNVSAQLQPLLVKVIPSTPWGYVFAFTIMAPLALYRGPS